MATRDVSNNVIHGRLDPAFLDGMFQGAGLAVIACNPEARIAAWNPAATQLFGASEALREGGVATDLLPEPDRITGETHFRRCVQALEPSEFRVRLGGTDDDPIEYAVYVTPVIDPDEGLRGVAIWFRDISARVRLQRQVRKHERLHVLGSLSGAVAHHYNNMLCSIATSIEYASNMNTMAAMRRALRRATDSLTRAASITQQLLAFAQADHRDRDMADLTETVLYFCDEHEERLNQHRIRVQLDWHRIPVCPVPRQPLLIILHNVVENAIDAMPNGGTLAISLVRRDTHSILLQIADTGGGISTADMEHIFEPFHSSKANLGCGERGKAGLGLAVVHGLVHEMHGSISASNVPGRGARFDIVLPIDAPN
ncbi:MAG: nitrogen regulation protein NR(II) [Phycisphaerae bacterium]